MKYRIAKGVFDILPTDPDPNGSWRSSYLWQFVEGVARSLCRDFGFQEIRTPLFETTALFQRSIGSDTDIVQKEMYTFHDKAERLLTLRPEGTAPVMRAFIEKNLSQQKPVHKLYYLAPMFRYERQQKGRYRQHHQFGVEVVGNEGPYQDVEVISLLHQFYTTLGLKDFTLHINSLGTEQSRKEYRSALKDFLKPHLPDLSEDSQARFVTNCLRILDSKDAKDREILQGAPTLEAFLDEASREHFETVCRLLEQIEIPYQINASLVRGLDYYNHTVFEITSDALGAQNALGGGGRYDGLIQQLGGAHLPSVGFGTGIERVIQTLLAQEVALPQSPAPQLMMIPLGPSAEQWAFKLLWQMRRRHLSVEMDFSSKKLSQKMRYANTIGASFVAVIGEEELEKKTLLLKEMASGKEERIPLDNLINYLNRNDR